MRNIVKTTLVLTIGAAIITGCGSDSSSTDSSGGGNSGSGSSSMNDTITFSGNTSNFTVIWKKVYSQYSEVVVKPKKKQATSNTPETVTIECRQYNTSSGNQELNYACHPSNLSPGTDYSFSIPEGNSVEWAVFYKETAAGSGYDKTEGPTQFTLVNSNGNLSKQ